MLLWCGGIVAALLQTWAFRFDIAPDGISYLDIAKQCAQGNWHSLINAYWSPLYPFLLSLAFRLLRPSPHWESTVAHFVNFAIFVASFVCFEVFMKALIHNQRRSKPNTNGEPIPEWALWLLGDSLFVWATLLLIHLGGCCPIFVSPRWFILPPPRFYASRQGKAGWLTYARFGAVLGLPISRKQ